MLPHERSLVKRLEKQPFVLLGVNSDRDRHELKKTMENQKITWPSFWDGGSTDGPISKKFNVRAWPTLYLIDHTGTIRHKWTGSPGPSVLDRAIDALIKKAGDAAGERPKD